ncbi:MAG: hypothetical protein ACOYLS_01385 [Polymorphobacter sp.]
MRRQSRYAHHRPAPPAVTLTAGEVAALADMLACGLAADHWRQFLPGRPWRAILAARDSLTAAGLRRPDPL